MTTRRKYDENGVEVVQTGGGKGVQWQRLRKEYYSDKDNDKYSHNDMTMRMVAMQTKTEGGEGIQRPRTLCGTQTSSSAPGPSPLPSHLLNLALHVFLLIFAFVFLSCGITMPCVQIFSHYTYFHII